MSKEIDDYVDRWFAVQKGEPAMMDLVVHPNIQNWFAAQRGEAIMSPKTDNLIPYIQRRIKELDNKKT